MEAQEDWNVWTGIRSCVSDLRGILRCSVQDSRTGAWQDGGALQQPVSHVLGRDLHELAHIRHARDGDQEQD